MTLLLPYTGLDGIRTMIFVDGENLAIRYGAQLKARNNQPPSHVTYRQDIYVWTAAFRVNTIQGGGIVRTYYYTSVQGDYPSLTEIEDQLKEAGVEAPRVFKRTKSGRSKRVDISLATDMLTHAHSHHYEVALLFAGDEDYVPLVQAVQREGCRVQLCFIQDGLSPVLVRACDGFSPIEDFLFPR
jgi:uncharacterized LabA/DUF88 family protein